MAVFDLPNGEKLNVPDQYLGDVDMASNIKDVMVLILMKLLMI